MKVVVQLVISIDGIVSCSGVCTADGLDSCHLLPCSSVRCLKTPGCTYKVLADYVADVLHLSTMLKSVHTHLFCRSSVTCNQANRCCLCFCAMTDTDEQMAMNTYNNTLRTTVTILDAPLLNVLPAGGTKAPLWVLMAANEIVGQDLCAANDTCSTGSSSSSSDTGGAACNTSMYNSSLPQAVLLQKVMQVPALPMGWPCSANSSTLLASSRMLPHSVASLDDDQALRQLGHSTILDMAFAAGVIDLKASEGVMGSLAFREVTLRGLPQGPALQHRQARTDPDAPVLENTGTTEAQQTQVSRSGGVRRLLQAPGSAGTSTPAARVPDVWTQLIWSVSR